MALTAKQAWILANNYTDQSIEGTSGVLAGKNCTIQSVEDIENDDGLKGHRITFAWHDNDGDTVRTEYIDVYNGETGPEGPQGEQGDPPEITVKEDTTSSYILHVKSGDTEFDTPNLMGSGGGTNNYNNLSNKPSIEGRILRGALTLEDIGDVPISQQAIVAAVKLAFGN